MVIVINIFKTIIQSRTHISFFGCTLPSSKTRLNATAGSLNDTNETEPNVGTNGSAIKPVRNVSKGPAKRKRARKARLIVESRSWVRARTVAQGQERIKGSKLKFNLNVMILIVKLYSKSITIESVKQGSTDSSILSFPIVPSFRDVDLQGRYNQLTGIEGFVSSVSNPPFNGDITPRTSPLTIPMITLPYRLLGFNPSVIRSMSESLSYLLKYRGYARSMGKPHERYDIAPVRAVQSQDSMQVDFYAGDNLLNKTLVREIRAILMVISSPDQPTQVVLNLIKNYFYVLKSACDVLNTKQTKQEQE